MLLTLTSQGGSNIFRIEFKRKYLFCHPVLLFLNHLGRRKKEQSSKFTLVKLKVSFITQGTDPALLHMLATELGAHEFSLYFYSLHYA